MNKFLLELVQSIFESFRDLLPIILVVSFFQLFVLRQPIPNFANIFVGAVMVVIGLAFFIRGLQFGLFPIGESMARAFARKGSIFWLLSFAFSLGFGTTFAEPSLIAIGAKASEAAALGHVIENTPEAIKSYTFWLRFTVALSVGCSLVLGVLRILKGWPLHYLIISGYIIVVFMTAFAPREIIGIAYDSGGVTTSTITVPLVAALGVGLATSIKGRNPMLDGFGLIAFASLMPIAFTMIFGMIVQ